MDSKQSGSCVCLFIGAVSILIGLVLLGGALDSQFEPDAAQVIRLFGMISIAEGGVYIGLGFGISKGVPICAIIAAGLYTASSLLMVVLGQASGGCGGPVLRVVFLGILWKVAWDLWPGRQERIERQAEEHRMARFDRISPRSSPTGAPIMRRTERIKKPDDDLAHMRCPNCHRNYDMDAKKCEDCNVALFEWT